jgi:hypothetical protein
MTKMLLFKKRQADLLQEQGERQAKVAALEKLEEKQPALGLLKSAAYPDKVITAAREENVHSHSRKTQASGVRGRGQKNPKYLHATTGLEIL